MRAPLASGSRGGVIWTSMVLLGATTVLVAYFALASYTNQNAQNARLFVLEQNLTRINDTLSAKDMVLMQNTSDNAARVAAVDTQVTYLTDNIPIPLPTYVRQVVVDGMSGLEVNHTGPAVITDSGSLSLTLTPVATGMYTHTKLVVDPQGRLTFAANGPDYGVNITELQLQIDALQATLSMLNMTVENIGGFNVSFPTLLQNVQQLLANNATVREIDTGVGLTGGPITVSGTISIADTSVTPGKYERATIMVDQQGRITMAAR